MGRGDKEALGWHWEQWLKPQRCPALCIWSSGGCSCFIVAVEDTASPVPRADPVLITRLLQGKQWLIVPCKLCWQRQPQGTALSPGMCVSSTQAVAALLLIRSCWEPVVGQAAHSQGCSSPRQNTELQLRAHPAQHCCPRGCTLCPSLLCRDVMCGPAEGGPSAVRPSHLHAHCHHQLFGAVPAGALTSGHGAAGAQLSAVLLPHTSATTRLHTMPAAANFAQREYVCGSL